MAHQYRPLPSEDIEMKNFSNKNCEQRGQNVPTKGSWGNCLCKMFSFITYCVTFTSLGIGIWDYVNSANMKNQAVNIFEACDSIHESCELDFRDDHLNCSQSIHFDEKKVSSNTLF